MRTRITRLSEASSVPGRTSERDFFIDNLLVRIHFIIVMIRWTGLVHQVEEAVALLGKMAAPGLKERRLMVELLLQDICGSKATGPVGAEQLLRACDGNPCSLVAAIGAIVRV